MKYKNIKEFKSYEATLENECSLGTDFVNLNLRITWVLIVRTMSGHS